ncbi:hypothetical protein ACVH9Z_04350 [Rhodococcus opacus]|uniref:Pullulanase n=1 Tax=Rhodococcus opacus TaxID=37919 RepID=A0AAX3YDT9_RHOOP|nr:MULTISPECIES: hypothetical protein [Rhodococcus]ELB86447.1 hypothetical protein Rwratislav_44951 [Rhodococcus wratislaviensis IFP 2016]NHU47742.1 hypothetical protein [Rhodococcus sp. A14]QDQ89404.1 hypothetical protein FND50_00510 [Rhodococcus sp. WB9]MBA8961062.1 hypothetical protein [Rhodococcus opacus]MBP2203072.1 hypothetical protein [Rhodococcus opacus]
MDPLEYSFGTGADAPTAWTSPADLDLGSSGGVDAVRLDFDGDGLLDDAMWDSDGDGVADRSVLDYDADDEARYFTDPSGNGTWNVEMTMAEPPVIAAVHTWRPDPMIGAAGTIDVRADAGQGGLGFQTNRVSDEGNTP